MHTNKNNSSGSGGAIKHTKIKYSELLFLVIKTITLCSTYSFMKFCNSFSFTILSNNHNFYSDSKHNYYRNSASSTRVNPLLASSSSSSSVRRYHDNLIKGEVELVSSNNNYKNDQSTSTIPKNIPKLSDIIQQYKNKNNSNNNNIANNSSTKNESVIYYATTETKEISKKTQTTITIPLWKASVKVSRAMQEKLKLLGSSLNNKSNNDCKKELKEIEQYIVANKILSLILSSPTKCNEMNIVYAITLCAKIITNTNTNATGNNNNQQELIDNIIKLKIKFIKQFKEILYVLDDLIVINNQLSSRQLANVAWALVRINKNFVHYCNTVSKENNDNRQTLLLLFQLQNEVTDKDEKLNNLLEIIAINITKRIEEHNTNDNEDQQQRLKSMELCMIAWAFATYFPRLCPPGWQYPSKEVTLSSSSNNNNQNKDRLQDFMLSFEYANDYFFNHHDSNIEEQYYPEAIKLKEDDTKERKQNDDDSIMSNLFNSIAYAFTSTRTNDNDYENDIINEKNMLLNECTWKELSVLAWSYAHHGHDTKATITSNNHNYSENLIQSITNIFINRLEEENHVNGKNKHTRTMSLLPRDISLLAWSLGILQSDNFEFSNCLICVIHTITKFYVNHATDTTTKRSIGPFHKWENTDLVQLAHTLGRARIDPIIVLKPLYEEVLHRIQYYNDNDTSRKQTKYYNHKQFTSWELTSLLYVQARLYLTNKQDMIFDTFSNIVPHILLQKIYNVQQMKHQSLSSLELLENIGMKSQEQANLAWSLTVLETYKNDNYNNEDNNNNTSMKLIQHILSAASESTIQKNRSIKIEHAHQLWQTLFLVKEQNDDNNHNQRILIDEEFEIFLEQKWKMEKTRHKISSARHKSLSQTLNFMGVKHYNEHDEDIDVAIVLNDDYTTSANSHNDSLWTSNSSNNTTINDVIKDDKGVSRSSSSSIYNNNSKVSYKVAVEFDGPAHFTRIIDNDEHSNYPPRALGHTVLKYRLLKKQGWAVVRVPYYEFDKIPYWASMERQRYLQRLLKTHDVIRFSDTDVSEYKVIVNNRQSRYD